MRVFRHLTDLPGASTPPAPPATPAAPPAAPAAPAVPPAGFVPIVPPAAPAPAPATDKKPVDPVAALQERINALEASNLTNLRARIAAETGIGAAAAEFLTADDEAGIKAQAEKLKAISAPASPGAPPAVTAPAAPPAAPPAGTVTNPAGQQEPTIDEQIAAAQKAGNTVLAISLKRQQAFGK